MAESKRRKTEKLYLEGVPPGLRSPGDCQTEATDRPKSTEGVQPMSRMCGKTERPGLCGGRLVTGVPTVRDLLFKRMGGKLVARYIVMV